MAEHSSAGSPPKPSRWTSNKYQRVNDEVTLELQDYPNPPSASKHIPDSARHDEDTMYVPLRDVRLDNQDAVSSLGQSQSPAPRRSNKIFGWWSWRFHGWRAGVMSCAASSTVVFFVNLIVTIWATSTRGVDRSGQAILYDGQCPKMRSLNTWLHLLINVLSSILLSSSNYCMQCLSAPTRAEVDEAHIKGIWLDVGIPSFRNLRHIRRLRAVLWFILGLSSLPLHLLYAYLHFWKTMLTVISYNSAVFSSISAYGYSAFTVSPSFVSGPYTDLGLAINASFRGALGLSSSYVGTNSPDLLFIELQNMYDLIHNNSADIEMLEKQDCINAYAQNFVSNRATLVMPAAFFNQSESLTLLGYGSSSEIRNSVDPFGWICSQQGYFNPESDSSGLLGPCRDRLDGIRFNSSGWMPDGYEIEECYSQRVDEHCKVQFSLHLAVVVILFNALKAGVMFYMALRLQEEPLMTMGDAVSSFLQREDPSSRAMCLASKKLITSKNFVHYPNVPLTLEFRTESRRWYIAASLKRWATCITMFLLALILVSVLLAYGISYLPGPKNATAIGKLGLGEINTYAVIPFNWELEESVTGAGLLITNVILANMAQPVLSFLYFTYNGLCTCMFLAQEWNSYSRERKGLRVSGVPVGAQRGTYFLQLPYRYGMSLVGLSALLHWLVSQSIFLVRVDEIYLPDPRTASQSDGEPTFTSCGYSPLAIIFVITVGGLMVLAILGLGARRYRGGMPVVGSCSLGMAAACHRGGKDADGWKSEVRWGLDGEAHCVFSTESVELPVEGKLYS